MVIKLLCVHLCVSYHVTGGLEDWWCILYFFFMYTEKGEVQILRELSGVGIQCESKWC